MELNSSVANHWYPKELRARALVDEYLEWQVTVRQLQHEHNFVFCRQHNNTRMACAMYFQTKWLIPLMSGNPPSESKIAIFQAHMEKTLDSLENIWLESSDKAFIASNEISFADILAACELEQPKMASYDPFEGRPRLTAWYKRVKELTSPFYDEAHHVLNKIVNSNKKKPKL